MAEFVEVMKQKRRMCESIIDKHSSYPCKNCRLSSCNNHKNLGCVKFTLDFPEESEEIIMDWAKEHPAMTNGDKFKEVFGFRHISSCPVPPTMAICSSHVCSDCPYSNFWKKEYKEPKGENE